MADNSDRHAGDIFIYEDDHLYESISAVKKNDGIFCCIHNGESGLTKCIDDEFLQAIFGLSSVSCYDDLKPVLFSDGIITGQSVLYAVSCIVAALWKKNCTSETGAIIIHVSQKDVALNSLITFIPSILRGDAIPALGNRHPGLSPWNCYSAVDGPVFICAPTDRQWLSLCRAIGRNDCLEDSRFKTLSDRLIARDAIDEVIAPWVKSRTVDRCLELLNKSGVPSGPVLSACRANKEANVIYRKSLGATNFSKNDGLFCVPFIFTPFAPTSVCSSFTRRNVWPHPKISEGLLAGLRVLELGTNTAAPLPAKQMGALGAHVLKIESSDGDPIRKSTPFDKQGVSHLFYLSNTDKQSLRLNLNNASDREILKHLIGSADILIENLKPGAFLKWGFTVDDLARINPKLVYTSISGFGHSSIYPGRPAYDAIIQAISGCMAELPDKAIPLKVGVSISDLLGGQVGLLASVVGAIWVQQGNCGAHFDVSMQDAVMWNAQGYRRSRVTTRSQVTVSRIANGHLAYRVSKAVKQHQIDKELRFLEEDAAIDLLRQAGVKEIAKVRGISDIVLSRLLPNDNSNHQSDTRSYVLPPPMQIMPFKIQMPKRIECINVEQLQNKI